MSGKQQRWQVLFSGHVQGVGFRYTSVRAAAALNVHGWVRNLTDGRVELVAEGEVATLQQLVEEICRTTHGNVSGHTVESSPATGEFSDFAVRYDGSR